MAAVVEYGDDGLAKVHITTNEGKAKWESEHAAPEVPESDQPTE